MLPAVSYGYEKLTLTLAKEHSLWVFGNKVPKRITVLKEEVTGGWRKLYRPNKEFHNLTKSKIRWARHAARMGWMRNEVLLKSTSTGIFVTPSTLPTCILCELVSWEQPKCFKM
jgi:hypothetical protein